MSQIKVSVIVPVYNTEKYLNKCLQSLVSQTLSDIEIVVINDGSTDGSLHIINEFVAKYPDKFLFFSKENGGQASARNIGIEKCNGEYIGFLDSDDFVSEEMFEKMYCAAIKENADYVACGYTDLCEENGKQVILKEYVASKVCKETRDMYFGALVSPFLHLYRADIVKNSGVRFTEGLIYEDTSFYINLIPYIKRVACIEEALAYRMRRSNSTTTTISAARVAQIFGVIKDVENWYANHNFEKDYTMEKEYMCVRILLGSSMERVSKIADRSERKKLIIETFSFLDMNYPKYRENKYFLTDIKSRFLRSLTVKNCYLYVSLLRVKNMMRKEYQ